MFSFFKSKPKLPEISDRIWMSETAKALGFYKDIQSSLGQQPQVQNVLDDPTVLDNNFSGQKAKICVLYFFEDTLKSLSTAFKDKISTSFVLMSALELEKSSRLQHQLKEIIESGNYKILFAEHYPLARVEKPILEKIATLSPDTIKVCFYASLEDPIMQAFGSDRITTLMKQLGMEENDVLEHKMISTSLQKAQEKVDSKVKNELKTDSAKEWFLKNLK